MKYFWDTSDTIPEGLGFEHFSLLHLAWLGAMVAIIAVFCIVYRNLGAKSRSVWKKSVAALLIADELFKLIPMLILGRFYFKYLPFHLCSINLFLITWHAWKPNKLLDNFLYTVCIPGALAAMLFPSWTELPAWNYMLIHSFTVHIMLTMYPVVLTVNGEIKPEIKELPKSLLLLACLAAIALVLNILFDTNFMFLMEADPGNPLYAFEKIFGSHLAGFPILIAAVILVMYGPWEICRRIKMKKMIPKA